MRILGIKEVIAVLWSLTALAILFTLGRFVIHWRHRKRLGWDDFFNGVALVFLLAFSGTWQVSGPVQYTSQLYTMGIISEDEVYPGNRGKNAKYNAANSIVFWVAIYAVKASFLALYWNIFEISTRFRLAWAISSVYVFTSFGMTIMWSFWICGEPLNFLKEEQCLKHVPSRTPSMFIAWCVLDIVGDLILMIVPIAMLKPLLMKLSQKLELSIIFGLVTVNIVLTVLRTVYSVDLDFANFPDRNVVWCFLQVTLSVIVCALPCYRGTLMRTKNGWLKNFSRFGSRDSETGGFWQRYFTSSGERSSESIKKEMVGRTSSGSGSTHPEL